MSEEQVNKLLLLNSKKISKSMSVLSNPIDSKMASRLVLGTAQLGMPYGVANSTGQPDQLVAARIVREAWEGGIHFFDTAQGYGQSEEILGCALRTCGVLSSVKIITKLTSVLGKDIFATRQAVQDSMQKLSVTRLYCAMLHREEQLYLLNEHAGEALADMQQQGLIEHIGISVYSPAMALAAIEHPLISIIQLPSSLFDRRFVQAGVFEKARALAKNTHIRSIFLQGVLTMSALQLPCNLIPLAPFVTRFHELCAFYDITPACAALVWALRFFKDSSILFGAETVIQVQQNLASLGYEPDIPEQFYKELTLLVPPQETHLLNPSLWTRS